MPRVNERVNRLANALVKRGVERGDRIGILHVNCNQYIETYFAAAKLGAIFVPLNFRAKADELAYMIGNAEVKILFVGEQVSGSCQFDSASISTVKEYVSIEGRTRTEFLMKICSILLLRMSAL